MNSESISAYLAIRYGITNINFDPELGNITLADDGNGPFIKSWKFDVPKPSIDDLNNITKSEMEIYNEQREISDLMASYKSLPKIVKLLLNHQIKLIDPKNEINDDLIKLIYSKNKIIKRN
jgi:hypothetical protein